MTRPPISRLSEIELSRRRLAQLGLAAPAAVALAGAAPAALAAPAAGGGESVCVLTPAQTEGPYYFDTRLQRGDITEGLPGLSLRLQLQVLSLPSCAPLPGAIVDIWHCAADGRYSGYAAAMGQAQGPGAGMPPPGGGMPGGPPPGGQPGGGGGGTNVPQISGETFLRGYLRTDGTGSAEIRTIYPGWYTGRTPHIHIKVWLGDQALTSQMYMPDAVTNAVYGRPPYAARPGRDIATNESDGIYQQTSGRTILSLIPAGAGMIGRLTLAVVPGTAGLGQTAVVGGGPGGMGGPPPVTP